VSGGFYHANYDSYNNDYNVAVLQVCTDFDIPIDISKYMKFLQRYLALSHSSLYTVLVLQFVCSKCRHISHIHVANINI